jgi:hypothetical protein
MTLGQLVTGVKAQGVTMDGASQDLRLIGQRLNEAYPPPPSTIAGIVPRSWTVGRASRIEPNVVLKEG